MSDLRDLMTSVSTDLEAVRWPPADELRGRVRRRRNRQAAAAVAAAVVAVTAGLAGLAGVRPQPPSPPADPSPSVLPNVAPVEIPPSVLLPPDEVGAGPDSQDHGVDAAEPVQAREFNLCREDPLSPSPRYQRGVTHLRGTDEDRPERPFVLEQQVFRFAAPDAAGLVGEVRSVTAACDTKTVAGELEVPGEGAVRARVVNTWSVAAEGFAGDESVVVRRHIVARDAETGRQIRAASTEHVAYVRVGDLVTRLAMLPETDREELLRIATLAAGRLCAAAQPRC